MELFIWKPSSVAECFQVAGSYTTCPTVRQHSHMTPSLPPLREKGPCQITAFSQYHHLLFFCCLPLHPVILSITPPRKWLHLAAGRSAPLPPDALPSLSHRPFLIWTWHTVPFLTKLSVRRLLSLSISGLLLFPR